MKFLYIFLICFFIYSCNSKKNKDEKQEIFEESPDFFPYDNPWKEVKVLDQEKLNALKKLSKIERKKRKILININELASLEKDILKKYLNFKNEQEYINAFNNNPKFRESALYVAKQKGYDVSALEDNTIKIGGNRKKVEDFEFEELDNTEYVIVNEIDGIVKTNDVRKPLKVKIQLEDSTLYMIFFENQSNTISNLPSNKSISLRVQTIDKNIKNINQYLDNNYIIDSNKELLNLLLSQKSEIKIIVDLTILEENQMDKKFYFTINPIGLVNSMQNLKN